MVLTDPFCAMTRKVILLKNFHPNQLQQKNWGCGKIVSQELQKENTKRQKTLFLNLNNNYYGTFVYFRC